MKKITTLLILLTLSLHAIEGAVSAIVKVKESYAVSEEIVIQVDLKSTAYSLTQSKIGLENNPNYIITAPTSAVSIETVDINGTDWSVVHYEYKLYPLHAGKLTILPIPISFEASMGYGQESQNFELTTKVLNIDIQGHKGVNPDKFILSTPQYSLKVKQTPKINKLKVGDAFELQVIQEAQNVPDILLTPIYFSDTKQFKVYTKEAKLESSENRGVSGVSRRDSFTFVAIEEGNITLPSQELFWWDTENKILHTEKTPQLSFFITAQAKLKSIEEDISNKKILSYFAIVLLVITLLYRAYPLLQKRRQGQKEAYTKSELGLFEALQKSCHNATAKELYKDFYIWLESADATVARLGFKGIIEIYPPFSQSLSSLEKALDANEVNFDRENFCISLRELRTLLIEEKSSNIHSLIDTINPHS